ncbi:hypothetical protein BO86DRAFT_452870, partial [Aspergillus japonicus CBS 114.51]
MEVNSGLIESRRVAQACESCKKGKRKCDGAQPACSLCLRLDRECYYSERPARRKRIFVDKEYVESLVRENTELRVKIDALTAATSARHGGRATAAVPEGPDRGGMDEVATDTASSTWDKVAEDAPTSSALGTQSAIDELTCMTWKLTIGTKGEPSFLGPSGGISFPGLTVDAPLAREPDLSHTSCETEPTLCDFTDDAVEDQLIEYFMQHVASYYGFLDPRELRQMGNLCNEEDIQFYRHAACIAGSCYSPVAEGQAIGNKLADLAQRAAVVQCASRPRELTVLSLSVLAWRELSLGQENMGWMYIFHLGLHVLFLAEPSDNRRVTESFTRRPISLKVFWSYFLVERMATTDLGRHCNLAWGRVGSPVYSGFLRDNASIEEIAFAYQCELWHLHDIHMDQIYTFQPQENNASRRSQLLANAHAALISFYDRLDARLHLPLAGPENSSFPSRSVIYLHMSYYNSSLLIHRPFLRQADEEQQEVRGQESINAQMATQSVREPAKAFAQLVRLHHRRIGDFRQAPPFLIQHLLTAGIMFLSQATAAVKQGAGRRPCNDLKECLVALEEMQESWPLKAHRAMDALRQIAYRWSVVWALPMHL